MRKVLLLLVAAAVASAAYGKPGVPTQKSLTPAVEKYLQEKGNFCLGKFSWPIDVSEHDRQARSKDAFQMPVLEKLGLVSSSNSPSDPTVTKYDLTAEGRKYYMVKKTVTIGPGEKPVDHPGDFCVAKLKLDRVVSWDPPAVVGGRPQTTVKYTYKVASAADWTHDPDVMKVFPMIPRILEQAGTQQLEQVFAWSSHGWVAVTPGD
jgi:hypothetical protein